MRNLERRLERQRTLEESMGITETQPNGDVVANGNVPHHTEAPAVNVNEYTDTDRHIVHVTVHKEGEGLSNGTIPVANGNCLSVPEVAPPDYEEATKVTANGDVNKEPFESNHVIKAANGDLIKTDHVIGNGVIPDGSTKPGNLTDEQKATLSSSAAELEQKDINHHLNENDTSLPNKMDNDSLEGNVFGHGAENEGFEAEADMMSECEQRPPNGDVITATRASLGDIHQIDGYIKELVYP